MKFLGKFKSHRKAGLHPLSRKHNFGKCRGGGQIDRPLPTAFLEFTFCGLQLY